VAREAKGTTVNRTTTVAAIATVGAMGAVGVVGSESEEVEAEEDEAADSSLEARLEKAMAEPDYEREEIFRYLKEFRKRKRLGLEQTFERQEEAREKARAAVERMLEEDAERSARESEGTMNDEAMVESAGVGIAYIEDENGKLTKRRTTVLNRTPARRKTPTARRTPADAIHIHGEVFVQDENGKLVPYVPPPPGQFTEKDLERVSQKRDRYTRAAWDKELRAIAEGRLTMTKEQFQALIAYGRFKGWNRRPPPKR